MSNPRGQKMFRTKPRRLPTEVPAAVKTTTVLHGSAIDAQAGDEIYRVLFPVSGQLQRGTLNSLKNCKLTLEFEMEGSKSQIELVVEAGFKSIEETHRVARGELMIIRAASSVARLDFSFQLLELPGA